MADEFDLTTCWDEIVVLVAPLAVMIGVFVTGRRYTRLQGDESLRSWIKQHEIDHGEGGGTTTAPTAGDHGSVDRSALPVGPVD